MAEQAIIVVGGGAAGLMAAGQAAEAGAEVLLLEKKSHPARKIGITGKGRCNLTNDSPLEDFLEHYGRNGRFLRQAFNRFFAPDLAAFLGRLGVEVIVERGGRVFPVGEDAVQVAEALVRWVKDRGVMIKTGAAVTGLIVENGRLAGVKTSQGEYRGRAVILATGGASYPATGSTGDGYRLAAEAGHAIVPIRPALVPLETEGDVAPRLQGLSLRNVSVRLLVDGKKTAALFGEMLFTHFGLSGPIILTLSRQAVDALAENKTVTLAIDLKPALDDKKLDARLLRDLQAHGKRQFHTLLKDLLPRTLIPVCIDEVGIAADKAGHQVTSEERARLRRWLKDFRFDITGHRGFTEAIVTAGGVETREVDPRTMASKVVDGLYLAGEVLDIDGDTGGYNLQAAFSTGWLAGRSAAER